MDEPSKRRIVDIGHKSPGFNRNHVKMLLDHERRLKNLETVADDISEIKTAVFKIAKYIKVAAPSLVSAAIAAGVVNGKLGAFLAALMH